MYVIIVLLQSLTFLGCDKTNDCRMSNDFENKGDDDKLCS